MAVDGASFLQNHFYALILINSSLVRLYDIIRLPDQKSTTISNEMLKCYLNCQNNDIFIAGVVSDNAHALKTALEGDHPLNLHALLGESVIRVACAAHSAQLVLADLAKQSPDFKSFAETLLNLFTWIKNREHNYMIKCPKKIPFFICTRWNSLCSILEYFIKYSKIIDDFISDTIKQEARQYEKLKEKALKKEKAGKKAVHPDEPTLPPVQNIPNIWIEYLQPLSIIKNFTEEVEGDMNMQYDVYKSYNDAILKFELLPDSKFKTCVYDFFKERFISTADIEISRLSYAFTFNGLNEFRQRQGSDKEELIDIFTRFVNKALSEESVKNNYLIACFEYYLDQVPWPQSRSSVRFWKSMQRFEFFEPELNNGKKISYSTFAKIALILVSLPVTEAIAERFLFF